MVVLGLPEEVYRRLAMRAFRENRTHRVAEVAADVLATAVSAAGGNGNGVDAETLDGLALPYRT